MKRNLSKRTVKQILSSIGFGAAVLGAASSRAAVITAITSSDVPISSNTSVFDAGNTGNNYWMGAGTQFIPEGFDVRDLFGGSFGTFGPEQNDVIFNNGSPIGSVESIGVTLSAPVSLDSFSLYLEDDGTSGDRSASEFKLFAAGQLIDDISLLSTSGTDTYTSVYGSQYIQVGDTFTDAPVTTDYTLEFIQNRDGNGTSGVALLEFQGTGTPALASVPEPTALAGLISIGAVLLPRRRIKK